MIPFITNWSFDHCSNWCLEECVVFQHSSYKDGDFLGKYGETRTKIYLLKIKPSLDLFFDIAPRIREIDPSETHPKYASLNRPSGRTPPGPLGSRNPRLRCPRTTAVVKRHGTPSRPRPRSRQRRMFNGVSLIYSSSLVLRHWLRCRGMDLKK